MIFLSLRVTANAGGGLKIRAHQRPDLQGFGGRCVPVAHVHRTTEPTGETRTATNKRAPGIYRRIACRYLSFVQNALCAEHTTL